MLPTPTTHRTGIESCAMLSATPPALIATTRLTPALVIAGTRMDVTRAIRSGGDRKGAHGFFAARLNPRHDATASCPRTAEPRRAGSSTSPRTTRTPGGASNDADARTSAVTSCFACAATRTSQLPVAPDAPSTSSFMTAPRGCGRSCERYVLEEIAVGWMDSRAFGIWRYDVRSNRALGRDRTPVPACWGDRGHSGPGLRGRATLRRS